MISAVITNFNGKHILKKCLPETVSLLLSYSITDIIIADDCSTDDSLNYIKSSFPKVKTIKTPYNSGVSLACNVGASLAKENILLFLNNDMIPKLIDLNIVKELFKINTLFGFSPAIYRQIGTAKINETPSYGYFKGGWFNSVNNEDYLRNIRTTKPTPILWGCGGGLFVDHKKFKLLNGI